MDDEFRKLFEQQNRFAKLFEDAMGPTERLRRQLDELLEPSPALMAIQKMMADIEASPAHKRLMEQVERINQIGEPLRKQMESMRQLHESLGLNDETREAMLRAGDAARELPVTPLPTRIVDPTNTVIPEVTALERRGSPAEKVFDTIVGELEAEKADNQDQRHTVFLVVYLPDGTRVVVDRMSTKDGQVIEIEGTDLETNRLRTAKVGALGFQYDFVTIEHPPHLYLVK